MPKIKILELNKDPQELNVQGLSELSHIVGGSNDLPPPPPFRGTTVMFFVGVKF